MGRIIPYIEWKILEKCLKPPTRLGFVGKTSLTYGMMMLERLIVAWKLLLVDDYRGSY
jgi:hypothetical protein